MLPGANSEKSKPPYLKKYGMTLLGQKTYTTYWLGIYFLKNHYFGFLKQLKHKLSTK